MVSVVISAIEITCLARSEETFTKSEFASAVIVLFFGGGDSEFQPSGQMKRRLNKILRYLRSVCAETRIILQPQVSFTLGD
jgi:hypothetical protein